jgi:hypothetical protein
VGEARATSVGVSAWAGLFLAIFGARLMIISGFGVTVPWADEWDGEAVMFPKYVAGTLQLGDLLAPFNEHRIFTSRLLDLATFELAGGWDRPLHMVVNAALWAGFATGFTAFLAKQLAPPRALALVLFSALIFAVPLGFENALMAMNAHFYFLVIFSVLALHALASHEAFSRGWWVGCVWTTLAFLSMSSALAIPAAIIVVALMQMAVGQRRHDWRELAGLVVMAASVALMLSLTPTVPGSQQLHPRNALKLINALLALASAPLFSPIGWIIVYGPLLFLAWRTLTGRLPLSAQAWTLIAIGGWVAGQIVATSLARGLAFMPPRYFDVIFTGLPVGAAILLALDTRRGRRAAALWMALILAGHMSLAYLSAYKVMAGEARWGAVAGQHLRDYLQTDDPANLDVPGNELPYPSRDRLLQLASDPAVRMILPAGFSTPEEQAVARSHTLLKGQLSSAVESIKAFLLGIGPLVLGLGLIGLLLSLLGLPEAPSSRRSGTLRP